VQDGKGKRWRVCAKRRVVRGEELLEEVVVGGGRGEERIRLVGEEADVETAVEER